MKRFIRIWGPCLLWMGVIFFMSAMPGSVSSSQSGFFSDFFIRAVSFLTGGRATVSPDLASLLIRKAAHMAEYAILMLLSFRSMRLSGARRPVLYALLLCIFYAVSDEFHQFFVENRSASPIDVLIDTSGALIGMGFLALLNKLLLLSGRTAGRSPHRQP